MGIKEAIGLLGGLALFLYGMHMMSTGLEAAAGSRMKEILKKLTANRFLGVLVGAVITAIIQSSSATTVMVVGFVNAGMMSLQQAVWIIMGANIGTTITGQLIALDIGAIAPLIAFLGVVMVVFVKKEKCHHIGSILAGLGILFIGMDMMSSSMIPLRESKEFVSILTKFSNPLIGILAGAVFTAIIQSSSASVGILQALANSGAISFPNAVYVLFGQNIGTCITALLASIGTCRNAKRTTVIHLCFNIIGTTIFTTLCITTPLTQMVMNLSKNNPASQIANMHTVFNITTTLLLLPFGTLLAKGAKKLLPDREIEEINSRLMYIKDFKGISKKEIGVTAMNLEQVHKEIERMLHMAQTNVDNSFHAFVNRDPSWIPKVEEVEEDIDFLNQEISKYISTVITHETNEKGSRIFSAYFNITGNVERISDHAMNICGYSKMLHDKDLVFSKEAEEEIQKIQQVSMELLGMLLNNDTETLKGLTTVSALEQKIDDMTTKYRDRMMQRIKNKSCKEEASILYSEMLTDFERIGDHALNISEQYTSIRLESGYN